MNSELAHLDYNPKTKVATAFFLQDIHLSAFNHMWIDFINKGYLPKDTAKFLIVPGHYRFTDSAHYILANRGKFHQLFPSAILAVVTNDPVIIAIASFMNKENKQTQAFSNVKDALEWLNY